VSWGEMDGLDKMRVAGTVVALVVIVFLLALWWR
jgi:hypothetical protein